GMKGPEILPRVGRRHRTNADGRQHSIDEIFVRLLTHLDPARHADIHRYWPRALSNHLDLQLRLHQRPFSEWQAQFFDGAKAISGTELNEIAVTTFPQALGEPDAAHEKHVVILQSGPPSLLENGQAAHRIASKEPFVSKEDMPQGTPVEVDYRRGPGRDSQSSDHHVLAQNVIMHWTECDRRSRRVARYDRERLLCLMTAQDVEYVRAIIFKRIDLDVLAKIGLAAVAQD